MRKRFNSTGVCVTRKHYMVDSIEFQNSEYSKKLNDMGKGIENISDLSKVITRYIKCLDKEVVLIIDEDINSKRAIWDMSLIEVALKKLLKESNTLFDDLFKNIENNKELNDFIFNIIFNGDIKQFNEDNSLINLANIYGIIKESNGICQVSNRVFEQRIYNYFASKLETTTENISNYNFKEKNIFTVYV